MGAYVNPHGKAKELWLAENGKAYSSCTIPQPREFDDWYARGKMIVCLVDNGIFSAAAIAFSKEELTVFTDMRDTRPKRWYVVDIDKLYAVSDLEKYHPKEGANT